MNVTRRLFLRNTAASAAVAGTVISVAAAEPALLPQSAEERFRHHLDGLKKAAEEMDPAIGSWSVVRPEDEDAMCGIAIYTYRITGRYEGDGIYESGRKGPTGKRTHYRVRLLPDMIDGDRTFHVSTSMDRLVLTEPRFQTFLGKRVS